MVNECRPNAAWHGPGDDADGRVVISREHDVADGVAVVGAGPVGLTLACLLADAGVPVVVLERESDLSRASHASTFHPSSLEILRNIGVSDELLKRGLPVDTLQYRYLPDGTVVDLSYDVLADDTEFPFRLQCEQSKLTPLLLEHLTSYPHAQVRFDAAVEAVVPGDPAIVRGGGATPFALRAGVVVGCDGAHSAVRDALALEFEGAPCERPLLRIVTDRDLARLQRSAFNPVTYLSDDAGSMSLLTLPDHMRLGFRVSADRPEEVLLAPESLAAHVGRMFPGTANDVPVRSAQVIALHQRVADSFHRGNAYIIGDAAHLNDPSGGMGMNSGIHDAALLGPTLVEFLGGAISDVEVRRRLDERRGVVADKVVRRAARHKDMLDGAGAAWIEDLAHIAADKDRTRDYLRRVSMFDTAPPGWERR